MVTQRKQGRKQKRATRAGGRVIEVRVSEELTRVNEDAPGIDIGAERH